ncbi:MAG: hypothetical protein OHK0039_11030 [Bacteroidia bacterium]
MALVPLAIQQHGLDSPQAVGAFINNTLPDRTPSSTTAWTVENAFPNLTFVDPIQLLEVPGTNLFLVAGKTGLMWTFDKNNPNTSTKTTVLDISSRVITSGDAGFLGVVFHPEFGVPGSPNRGYLYVHYRYKYIPTQTTQLAYIRVSRFTIPDGSQVVDPNSEYVLIQQYDRHEWHNGGSMFFGPDGFLYISIGDEGGADDQYNNGQKINEGLLSGVLRIDVDQDPTRSHPIRRQPVNPATPPAGWPNSFSQGYFIPNDNPWQDVNGSILEEFWAIGLRSPHRMSYDPVTKWIWVGDVGQGSREEVSIVKKSYNLQWPYREGSINGAKPKPNPLIGIDAPPVYDYSRSMGVCVIGGLVYRGSKWNLQLGGKYIFGDHGTRNIYTIDYDSVTQDAQVDFLVNVPGGGQGDKAGISHFTVDSLGDIYVLKLFGTNLDGGIIYRIKPVSQVAEPPALLSQTGAFSNLSTMEPAPGFIPYELNLPFWSDNALKYRWIMIPNDGTHDSPAEQITYNETGEWDYPVGTVIVKHFELEMDENNPNNKRKLETRFLVHGTDGKYYGMTYRWRDDQSDAELLSTSRVDTLSIATLNNGPRELTWYYPNRQQCLFCHSEAANSVLGPKASQLNGDAFYHTTGRTANQLVTYEHLNIFAPSADTSAAHLATMQTTFASNDPTASLEDRALSYIDANCSSCHRPGSAVQALFDSRLSTDPTVQGMVYGTLYTKLGLYDPRIVVPQDHEHSLLYQRINSVHRNYAMPPLAKNLLDSVGVQLIYDWIDAMPTNFSASSNTIAADYQDDFSTGAPATGWSYLWNQGGAIGNSANYVPLLWNGTNYDSDGAPGVPDASTLQWGYISATGGHPGPGTAQAAGGNISRYVIAAFSVSAAGNYEIINSSMSDANNGCGNGSDVRVYVNNTLITSSSYANGGSTSFNVSLGTLQIGDVVYVAAGPGADQDYCDAFNLDYSIRRTTSLAGQRIAFGPIANRQVGDAPIALNATTSSGLGVTYQVSGPASLSGSTLTLTGQPGLVQVLATQAGNSSFAAAPTIERTFWVAPVGSGQGTGLRGTYYNDIAQTETVFNRVDTTVNFYWGAASPDPSMEYNSYAVVWEGEIEAPFSETFVFYLTADDGVRLYVGDMSTPLIDRWTDQTTTEFSATKAMTAWQRVPVRLEYYENRVYSEVMLEWSSASLTRQIVPKGFLYPAPAANFPVELLTFEAWPENGVVELEWATLTEQGASHFIVERSVDGEYFSHVATLTAAGNSTELQSYRTTDHDPYRGRSYYRLRQVDIDGAFSYSQIEIVDIEGREVRIFPNPVSVGDEISVQLDFTHIQPVDLRLVDVRGVMHHRQIITDVQRRHEVKVPTSGLSPGVYLLVVYNGAVQEVKKLIIR